MANPTVNQIHTHPYIDENNNKLYLFKIKDDNIEACNLVMDEMDKVNELFDKLKNTMNLYDGSGGIYGEKGAYVAMRDSYDCDEDTFFYVTWANDPEYENVNDDWNSVLLSFIDEVESCQ